ncbi:MAG: hypothetical protein JRJ19_11790 [Deltaproteobacteria bacterium]|nr:hypothetical protein [Deltaproteobacteria bacterium]MBW1872741.1 hypothetical protein [Deltaproteobacteria bacterium]
MRFPTGWLSSLFVLLLSTWFPFAKAQAGSMTIGLVASDSNVKTGARIALTGKGHKVQDVTWEFEEFHGISRLGTGNLDTPRPNFWPKELNGKWDQGLKACKSQAGKPPYGFSNRLAFLCGRRIARTFWQLWLDYKKFDLVIVIDARGDRRKKVVKLEAVAYGRDETVRRSISLDKVPLGSLRQKAGAVVLDLLAGKGHSETRNISRELPEVVNPITSEPDKEYSEAKVREISAVAVPAGCNPRVVALRVNPASSPLAKTITNLWVKSTKKLKKSKVMFVCSINVSPDSPASADDLTDFTATLKCRDFKLKETVMSINAAACHEGFAIGLVTKLLEKFCK